MPEAAAEATLTELFREGLSGGEPAIAAWKIFVYLFLHGGWTIVLVVLTYGLWKFWIYYIEAKYDATREWVLLAIDVPKDNEQGPKAVENIFAHLAGAHGTKILLEKYWTGATQDWFSLEIISIEGYVQFMVRTVTRFRDLVEAAVYSQYPDAVITEVEDYTTGFPMVYPNERYDMYGTEFVLVENQAYPIRTYPEFEHPLTSEFKDPMIALMETMGKLGAGEQLWLQMLVVPTDDSWKEESINLIKRLIGEQAKKKGSGIFGTVVREVGKLAQSASDQATGQVYGPDKARVGGNEPPNKILYLAPHEKEKVEGIARKMKKIGYFTKIRSVYVAPKEHYNVYHGREALIGAIKQFNTGDLNALKPDTKHVGVHANYLFTEWRKNWKRGRLMRWYRHRSPGYGRKLYVMNIEEIATLWHFPMKTMTTPLRAAVQKTEFKRIAPPSSVPFADDSSPVLPHVTPRAAPPSNLPTA